MKTIRNKDLKNLPLCIYLSKKVKLERKGRNLIKTYKSELYMTNQKHQKIFHKPISLI